MPATREQIYAALQAADKAGNTDDARTLAQMYAATPAPSVASTTGSGYAAPRLSAQQQADQAQQADDLKRFESETAGGGPLGAAASSFVHGASFGADDLLRASLASVGQTIQKGDIGALGSSFSNAQAALKKYRSELNTNAPIATTLGGVAGALAAPIGGVESLGAKAISKIPGAGALAATLGGSKAAQAAAEALSSPLVAPIAQGVKAGAEYGGLSSATENVGDPDFAGKTLAGVAGGGIGGAIGGAAATGAGIVGRAIADRSASNEANVAYGMIADALKGSRNPDTGVPYTADEIAAKMQAAEQAGNVPMVADQTRNLRGMTADLAQRSDSAANDIQDALAARQQAASDRVSSGINTALGVAPTEPTAFGLKTNIAQDLTNVRNDPTTGYDAVLKAAPVWNSTLEDIFARNKNNPMLNDAITQATKTAMTDPTGKSDPYQMVPLLKKFGIDPGSLGLTEPVEPGVTGAPTAGTAAPGGVVGGGAAAVPPGPVMQQKPSIFALDQVRRSLANISDRNFDLNNPNRNTALATNASTLRGMIKDAVSETHPQYADLMNAQQTLQDRAASVDQGQNFIKAMQNGNAEPWLAEAKAQKISKPDLAVGIGDALRNSSDPIGILTSMIQNPAQKEALSWAVGGQSQLDDFSRFIQNEVEQSITSMAAGSKAARGTLAPPSETDAPLSYISREAARGLPFGIPSGVLRGMNAVKSLIGAGPNPGIRNQLAAILTSNGQTLPAGADAAAAYRAAQMAARLRIANLSGRVLPALAAGAQVGQ